MSDDSEENRIALEDNSASKMAEAQGTTENETQDDKGGAQPQEEGQQKAEGGKSRYDDLVLQKERYIIPPSWYLLQSLRTLED